MLYTEDEWSFMGFDLEVDLLFELVEQAEHDAVVRPAGRETGSADPNGCDEDLPW